MLKINKIYKADTPESLMSCLSSQEAKYILQIIIEENFWEEAIDYLSACNFDDIKDIEDYLTYDAGFFFVQLSLLKRSKEESPDINAHFAKINRIFAKLDKYYK